MKIIHTLFLTLALALFSCGEKKSLPPENSASAKESSHSASPLAQLPNQNALSAKCQKCHSDIHHHWQKSDHGQANRRIDPNKDKPPFSNKSLTTTSEKWHFSHDSNTFTITANGKPHTSDMVIGIKPLIQYLTRESRGRWQTPSVAWDPAKKEWFDVFSGEARTEADWGHWTGRGMNWNTQCAWCHMTDFRKNYDVKTDSYASQWKEMGVGCTQCHGQIAEHPDPKSGCLINLQAEKDLKKSHPNRIYDNCATCHSRRSEFDDTFHSGDLFGDHYRLQLPTLPHLYYADGQIRDEDYVWTSLRLSNMGHHGVQCADCHDPHSTKLKLPLKNNALCMSCHAGGTNGRIHGATLIDPSTHSHHDPNSSGNSCVECHMTHTTYMGRDERRDHGFHIPDPQLTKEFAIPNACNKCHTDKDTDWAIKWTNTWYGQKMHTPERERQRARTRAIASVYQGRPNSLDPMLKAYAAEKNPYWQAALLQILQPAATDPRVQYLARLGVSHPDSIVRAASCELLEFGEDNGPYLEPMLQDPVKEVRLSAAWAWRTHLTTDSAIYKELKKTILFGADQPAGAIRMAQLEIDLNRLQEAEKWMKKAVNLDKTSAASHEYYAILLGQLKRPHDALKELQTAEKLDPNNARYIYLQALTYAELKQTDQTEKLLQKVVKLNPQHHRAWYNLGLLLAGKEKLDDAIASIRKAEAIAPNIPDYPYARATLHLRKGQKMQAFEACRTVLGINRNYQPALQLLRRIGPPNP